MVRRIYSVDLPELGCGGVREPWIPFSLIPEVSMTVLDGESMKQKFNLKIKLTAFLGSCHLVF